MFLLLANALHSQSELASTPYSDFSVDHLGNLYTVIDEDILNKLIETSEFEIEDYNYSNRALGNITNFNVTNPLKILVNHASFSTIVILDVTLRETARIYLPDLEIYSNPVAYAIANDNSVWLFDDVNMKLKRVNEGGELVFESRNLIQDLGFAPEITELQSNKKYLLAKDERKGLLLFDQFGTYIKQLPYLKDVEHFQLKGESVFVSKKGEIKQFPLEGIGEKQIATIPSSGGQFVVQNETLYFINELGIGEISIKKN